MNQPGADKSLHRVLALRPGDGMAAFMLGMAAIDQRQTTAAMTWLQKAGASNDPDAAEAWYHLALLQRERNENSAAVRSLEHFLKEAKPDNVYRGDALNLKGQWGGR